MEEEVQIGKPLFPSSAASLFPITHQKEKQKEESWLANASFSESLLPPPAEPQQDKGKEREESWLANSSFSESLLPPPPPVVPTPKSVDDSGAGEETSEPEVKKSKRRKKHKEDKHRKKKKQKEDAEDSVIGALKGTNSERKANRDIWVGEYSASRKEYYFETRGDRDNLAFESLYRSDIARYHAHQSMEMLHAGKLWKTRVGLLNPEGDSSEQDESLKSNGRYWSSKVASLERRRDFRRLQIPSQKRHNEELLCGSFISLELDEDEVKTVKEESYEDYILNKTRYFSQRTHDQPHDESLWISCAKFQDELIKAEKRKTMVQHAIDKKILLLEKALEYHPNSEELVMIYLETCRKKDDIPVLIAKWERMIMKHSGSYKLWWEYLRLRRSTFSKFLVSDIRRTYSQALQALCASRNRLHTEDEKVEVEMGIITIFVDLCRFEWQTGHHELSMGLLQAQLEFNYLCPQINLSHNNKLRLFEAFWSSGAPRIGEANAIGWDSWMQKEEEQIQNAKSMTVHKGDDESSFWSGWKQFTSAGEELSESVQTGASVEYDNEEDNHDVEDADDVENEDDVALLEKLGLNLDLVKDVEVKDTVTWKRWSDEEIERDSAQWLPVKSNLTKHRNDVDGSEPEDEQLEKMVLFDDIREHLFTLSTKRARFHLLGQFLEFCNAPLFQWCCSNARGYLERFDSLDRLTSDIQVYESFADILLPVDWIKESKGRAEFVKNTVMLLRDVFMHNIHFQEVLLSLQAMEAAEKGLNSDKESRTLAKRLLKTTREDLTLWAAYACFEASAGDVGTARKIFDNSLMALATLPKESQADAPVIYLAYAEVEMAQCANSEDYQRVLHVLQFLGTGEPYNTRISVLSKPQILKALRGYQDKLKKLYDAGNITESGASLVICAALFQQLTSGWQAAVSIFEQTLMTFPVNDNVHLERLLHSYISMLESHKGFVKPSDIRRAVRQGIEQYPYNLKLLVLYHQNGLTTDTRRFIDQLSQRNPSMALWLFALSCELSRDLKSPRIHNIFERALESTQSVLLWRLYISYELKLNNTETARRVFFRAIHACPWSKALWIDGFQKMHSILTAKELSDLVDIMRDKELRIRTDVYEILLQDVA